ncbi:MAG TPA: SMC-Scp complex subunit ScpB [Aestuariivirgaceae bacterium]|nr:SMC-Scp complex subunit ScpB [Aestuariivirgaceae bacterium]
MPFREAHDPEAHEPEPFAGKFTLHPRLDAPHQLRIVEALLFASGEPLRQDQIAACLPDGSDVAHLLGEIKRQFAGRGVTLVEVAGKWSLRTAADLSFLLRREAVEQRRLSRAALETLAIIAYHQPVTRADIEEVRGVAISRGTLDQLLEVGWVRLRGRRRTPGRPVTYGTTEAFLDHFGLAAIADLPGLTELKDAGLLDANLPPDFVVPAPRVDAFDAGEDALEDGDEPALELDLPDDGDPERD